MTDINSVVLVGRLTRDIMSDQYGFGYLPNGTAKARVSLAVNRSHKRGDTWEDETSYIDIMIFGKMAESLKSYLNKGVQIAVQGSLRQDRWEKDGKKQSKVYVVADTVRLLGNPRGGGSNNPAPSNGGDTYNKSAPQDIPAQNEGFTDDPPDAPVMDDPSDIPF